MLHIDAPPPSLHTHTHTHCFQGQKKNLTCLAVPPGSSSVYAGSFDGRLNILPSGFYQQSVILQSYVDCLVPRLFNHQGSLYVALEGHCTPYCDTVPPYCDTVPPYCDTVPPYCDTVLPYCDTVGPLIVILYSPIGTMCTYCTPLEIEML